MSMEAMKPRRYPTTDEVATRTLRLEERRFVQDYVVSDFALGMLDAERHAKLDEIGTHRIRFAAKIYVELDRRITVKRPAISINRGWPKTWWDAFKVRWFPSWMLDRFPPEIETVSVEHPPINIDEPVYKACYVNLPQVPNGGGMTLFEVMKPDKARERERDLLNWRPW